MTTDWLTDQSVPLWAFLVAILTSPKQWAGWARRVAADRLGVDEQGDDGAEGSDP